MTSTTLGIAFYQRIEDEMAGKMQIVCARLSWLSQIRHRP